MTSRNNISQLPDLAPLGIYNACSGALSLAVPQESVNMLISPSFELYTNATLAQLTCWKVVSNSGTSNADGWVVEGDISWSGAASFYSGNITAQTFQTLRYETLTVKAGEYYAWSFYVRGATSSTNRTYTTTIRDASTSAVYASKTFSAVEQQWQRVELTWYNTGATSVVLTIEKSAISGLFVGGDCYIDACQFESINPEDTAIGGVFALGATTYFDGSISGFYSNTSTKPEYAWRGFPHRSTSYRSNTTTHGGRIYNLQDECGFNVIAINEAGINQPNNQTVDFNTADGSALIDIINPKRTITIVGRISGADKNDFAMKMSKFIALFSRDLSALRLPRRYVFQHKNVRADVGVPMTFFAIFAGGLNVQMSSEYSADTELSLTMVDPYFYGHDESSKLTERTRSTTSPIVEYYNIAQITADVRDMIQPGTPFQTVLQPLGVNRNAQILGLGESVYMMKYNRFTEKLWIVGSFDLCDGVVCNNIATYDFNTKVFSPVMSGASNGTNGAVHCIDIAPNGDVWIGGNFTSAGGIANTAYCAYYRTNTFVGFTGAFNNIVDTVRVRPIPNNFGVYPYKVLVGGRFTTYAGGAMNRICQTSETVLDSFQSVPVGAGAGVNNFVNSIAWNPVNDAFYIGGQFTQSATGAYNANRILEYVVGSANATTPAGYGVNDIVNNVYADDDGTIIINGTFTAITEPGGGTVTASTPVIYINQVIKALPNGPISNDKPSFDMCRVRNGISSVPGDRTIGYWNGTAKSGTNYVPIAYAQSVKSLLELPDGSLVVGYWQSPLVTSVIVDGKNTSTAAAKPKIVFYNGTDADPLLITNMVNQKAIQFQNIFTNTAVDQTLNPSAFQKFDVVTIDTKTVTATSFANGNIAAAIRPTSHFTTFTIEPGETILTVSDTNQTRTSTVPGRPIDICVVYWPQTFQSIFDGVNKS